ncbi:geopeptide [Geobacter argillaceus]|nr:geopeptide [Geobacter argillaceus]
METETKELEVLDEGRESTEEVNSCCANNTART